MIRKTLTVGALLAGACAVAQAQDPVRIGFITTLSTPAGYIGEDLRDAFNLAIEEGGGKLGGVPVELVVEDDALKPANAKQAADRMVQSGVPIFTGVIFSNVLAAVVPSVTKADDFYISLNPGPSNFAGQRCDPNYFVVSYQNDAFYSAGGVAANELGYKKVAVLAPNYQAGRDAIAGFKENFQGEIAAEIYTKLDQSDFSVELARIRSIAPDAVYQFHPGGTGINFAKQYAAAGLNKSIPMIIPSFSMDAHMLKATGDAAEGVYTTGIWSLDTDTPQSRAFVEAFQKKYGRVPTDYAMQAYDTAQLMGTALKAVDGDMSRKDEFREAMRKADFESLRGNFRMNVNQHPIEDYYLMQIVRQDSGELAPRTVRKLMTDHEDSYAKLCKMPS
ncbi:ABC transporter substrate-binding protein [Pseudomonas sp. S 311-6]|jgi:branched-chain amino acid transport system substrate-binding protein|uniref:ABC transporter substrate-binding protein n=1 Tax=Kerstersia gyiorum TaxID=206506 RepID=UPI000FDC84FE|nr:ABC transporter substrate-binding protein [Kerstersia gyiorum]AZV93065.1 ABC transporter substrate-binding protein [Bordetella sp. J329]MCO7636686.1 ABC transporter substrate-binding protein [Pseudomonas sp. S 311-6]MCH4273237.1 ABC transporter substrate-binding protein [Kerstersia gyiorum]MCI1230118.1 ABC transporter substrate-binding protein [Kerstersia gyiorum]MCR4159063.1 ABC transporter substrate-binding protein [Kerstersia gyiorum]